MRSLTFFALKITLLFDIGLVHALEASSTQQQQQQQQHVKVINSPTLGQNALLEISYACNTQTQPATNLMVVAQIEVSRWGREGWITIYERTWRCKSGRPKIKSLRLGLPPYLAYRPDFFNRDAWIIDEAKLKVGIVDLAIWMVSNREARKHVFDSSEMKDYVLLKVLSPFSRPYNKPPCAVWYWSYLALSPRWSDAQICPQEQEKVTALDFPVAMNGNAYGVLRNLKPYNDHVLERQRRTHITSPRLTVVFWVYIKEYCLESSLRLAPACGLFVLMDAQGNAKGLSLLLNKEGQVQVDVLVASGQLVGLLTPQQLPTHTWLRLVFTLNHRTWTLHAHSGVDLQEMFFTHYTYVEDVSIDDADSFISLGGIDWTLGSHVGFIGHVTYHRGRVLSLDQIPSISHSHPMFELTKSPQHCSSLLQWALNTVEFYRYLKQYKLALKNDSSPYKALHTFLTKQFPNTEMATSICPSRLPSGHQKFKDLSILLRKEVFTQSLTTSNFQDGGNDRPWTKGRNLSSSQSKVLRDVGNAVIQTVENAVDNYGLSQASSLVQMLNQSSCLGSDDALFSLAVFLDNGVGTSHNSNKSIALFLEGAQRGHILSLMTMGHKHTLGLDGVPLDVDIAYMYFKQAADQSRKDKNEHTESGLATEMVRLSDEVTLERQTSEFGDLFLWLKHQAQRGVTSAQTELGQLLYWGAQGLRRNLNDAIDVFRLGAEDGHVESIYNYGIMQFRGQGAKENKTQGRQLIEKAAHLNNPDAINALGWMALEIDRNYSQAVAMFRQARDLGHTDSGFYLGHMYHSGLVPGEGINLDRAIEEYFWSTQRGFLDAGVMYAHLLYRGTPKYQRNGQEALEWVRFVGEKNSFLALPLRKGLDAYRQGNYDVSLYHYMLMAATGLEVGSFNLAYLCELNQNDVTSHMDRECTWRHYNMSTQREFHMVDALAYIKMGDYYWYGHGGSRDASRSTLYYSLAAIKGDPQALFNLGYMAEEGVPISRNVWLSMGFESQIMTDKTLMLLSLYSRCSESVRGEAFIPCSMAWGRIWLLSVWESVLLYLKVSSFVGLTLATLMTSLFFVHQFRRRHPIRGTADLVAENQDLERANL